MRLYLIYTGITTVTYLAELMKELAFTKPQLLLHHFDHLLNLKYVHDIKWLHPKSQNLCNLHLRF